MDDDDRFADLLWLKSLGADVDDAIGEMIEHRGAEDAEFQALVGPLMERAGVQLVWRFDDSPEGRRARLAWTAGLRIDPCSHLSGL